jgi:hypothetical protein
MRQAWPQRQAYYRGMQMSYKRPQGQQGQRTNGKAPFNGRPKFNSEKVHFNQYKEAAGNRMLGKRPPFKKAYNAGYNGQAGSNGGYHGLKHQGGSNGGHNGPKHQGGSLEELLMGNYKGKHFDPTKSRKYTALTAYFQRSGQSATGALPSSSSNGANAHGASANAILPLQDLQGLPPSYHNFAFALTIEGRGAELNDMTPYRIFWTRRTSIPMKATTLKWKKSSLNRYCRTATTS